MQVEPIDDDDDTGRIKVTKEDQLIAANRAIIESTSSVRITPGMWQALKERLARPKRRIRVPWPS